MASMFCYLWILFVVKSSWTIAANVDGECNDLTASQDCSIYKDQGRCNFDQWFEANCARTCGFCQPRAALFFVREPSSIVAVEGNNATFECKAASSTAANITYFWKFNQSYVDDDIERGFRLSSDKSSIQIIQANKTAHKGYYECVALAFGVGSIKSTPAKLQVSYFKIDQQKIGFIRVLLTKPLLIEIPKYESLPRPSFKWEFKNTAGKFVSVSNDPTLFVTHRGDLLIPSVLTTHLTSFHIYVYHQSVGSTYAAVFLYQIRGMRNPNQCANSTIFTYPTVTRKTAVLRQNVSFDCLAVAADCRNQISITWSRQETGSYLSSERKLSLFGLREEHGGTYLCVASIVGQQTSYRTLYQLQVDAKPKLTQATSARVNLTSNGLLTPAKFSNVLSFYWSKDGEVISNSSKFFSIYPDGRLNIEFPSPGMAGLYQMFFSNDAGTVHVTQDVGVPKGCGWTTFGSSGSINFQNPDTSSLQQIVTCTWLIQLPSVEIFRFEFLKMDFPAAGSNCSRVNISLFSWPAASGAPAASYCSTTRMPIPIVYTNGPFVIILLKARRDFLRNGGFFVSFSPFSRVLSSTAATKTTNTTASTTNRTVKFSTNRSLPSSSVTTSVTGIVPRKNSRQENNLPIAAISGSIIGGLILVAAAALFCCRKSLLRKFVRQKSMKLHSQKETLPRFGIVRTGDGGVINQAYEGGPRPSYSEETAMTPGNQSSQETHDVNTTYDSVGAIISTGIGPQLQHDEPGIYDVVGDIVKSFQKDHIAVGAKNNSKHSKSSSTKSEPFYHQLEDGANIAYESASKLKNPLNQEGTSSTLSSQNNQDFARIPSGRSDTQYTPLGDESTLASKENSIYESLTLDRVKNASLEPQQKEKEIIGEYCEPFDAHPQRSFRGESCVLYESGDTLTRENANNGWYGEYSEPFEQKRQAPIQNDQLYSEPL